MRAIRTGIAGACAVSMVLLSTLAFGRAQAGAATWESSRSAGGARQLIYTAIAPLRGAPTPIRLVFFCDLTKTRTETGALGFDLYVTKLAALAPFAFDDFEGPDAPALKRTLLRASVVRADQPAVSFAVAPSGWYPGDDTFAFGVSAASDLAASPARRLLTALAAGAERLQITITDVRDARVTLDVTVPVTGRRADFLALLGGVSRGRTIGPAK